MNKIKILFIVLIFLFVLIFSLFLLKNKNEKIYFNSLKELNYELQSQTIQSEVYRFLVTNGRFPSKTELLDNLSNVLDISEFVDPFCSSNYYAYDYIKRDSIIIGYRIVSAGIDKEQDLNGMFYSKAEIDSHSLYSEFFGEKDILVTEISYNSFFKDDTRKFSSIDTSLTKLRRYVNLSFEIDSYDKDNMNIASEEGRIFIRGKAGNPQRNFELVMYDGFDAELLISSIQNEVKLFGILKGYDDSSYKFHIGFTPSVASL